MGHTSVTTLSTTMLTGLQQVKNPFDHLPVTGDNQYNFDNSFVWDGVSNIVIQFCYNNDLTGTCTTCTGSTLAVEYTSSVGYNASAYYYEVITTPNRDMCGATNAATTQTGLPNVTFIRTFTNNTSLYNWQWSPGGLTGAITSASPTTTTTYTATATFPATGCSTTSSPVTVTVNPVTTGVLSGGNSYCEGQGSTTTALSIAVTGTGPWSGTLSPGAIPFSGSSSPIIVSVTPSVTTTYTIATLTDALCTATAGNRTGSATVSVNPVPATPTISAGGPVTFCSSGGSVTLNSSSATGNQWYQNGSPLIGQNGQTLLVTQSGSYTTIITNGFNCSSGLSNAIVVTVNPTPVTPIISAGGPVTFCQGGSVTLSSNAATGNQWYKDGNPIGGETGTSLLVSASGNYSVIVTSGAGCPSAASSVITVTANPLAANPTATVLQPTCALGTGTITVTAPLGTGNSYTLDGTTTITWPSVSFAGVAPGIHTITVTNSFGCSAAASASVTVDPQPFVPGAPVVTGTVNVCPYISPSSPTQLTYSATATGFGTQTFAWTLPPNVNLISGAGTNTIVITITNPAFVSQPNKQIRVTATNQCGTSVQTIYYLLAQLPTTPQPIVASTLDVCPSIGTNVPITYTIPKVTAATEYIWTPPAGTTLVHTNGLGVNDTTVTLTFSPGYATGNLTVSAKNDCGTSAVRSLTITRNNPSTPSPISGPTSACAYITPNVPATYTVAQVAGVTYNWNVNNGASIVTGQGTNSITVSFPIGYTSGTISVTATNGCGPSGVRSLSLTTLNPATPGVPDVINTVACQNRQYTYTLASYPANATNLVWTVPPTGNIVSGQGTTSITVSYPPTTVDGVVTVQASNPCAASSTRTVTVKLPACPPPGFGKGDVEVTTPTAEGLEVKVFPNPTVSDFKLQVITAGKEEINVRVLDAQGRLFKQVTVMPYQTINVGAGLRAGAYMIEVRQGKNVKTTRVLKF
jgi:hypothetical protein